MPTTGGGEPATEVTGPQLHLFLRRPRVSDSGFGSGLAILTETLNTDFDWLREHTRYLQRATEWDKGGRPASRLLSGDDIAEAKAWAARRPKNAPEPAALDVDFIRASEEESLSRRRVDLALKVNEDLQNALSDPDGEPA
ncbi:hypothetical protein ABIF68_002504 [Bradyrhizobium japonicum]